MSDSILQIREVQRHSAKYVIGLAGASGSGKTRSALELAYGMAGGDASKIGLLDTENRRGELFSDIFEPQRFLIGELTPPFSPARYIKAMREFADHGIEVLVIDSITHEWEGEGGCEEFAERPKANGDPRKIKDWIGAKREHKRFMNTLLYLPCHVICCVRAREKTDFSNPDKLKSLGLQPVTEKNVMFEMTASFLLHEAGRKRDVLKLPDFLESILGTNGRITREHGKALRDWIGGVDPIETAKNRLRLAAIEGTESLKSAWVNIPKVEREKLIQFKDTLKDLAAHADTERNQQTSLEEMPDAKWD